MNDPKPVLQIRLSYQTTDANVQNALNASVKCQVSSISKLTIVCSCSMGELTELCFGLLRSWIRRNSPGP